MRVVVTGFVATYPVGGVAWDYLQYVEGFRRLGCDVFYLEDSGRWLYDPGAGTFVPDATTGARYLGAALAALDPALGNAWSVRGADDVVHGRDAAHVARVCDGADLFLNLSGSCWLRDPYRKARVAAYVDTDPCYSQARAAAVDAGTVDPETRQGVELMRRHDVFFTLGENIGHADCTIPTVGIAWKATRQPIVLERWPTTGAPGGRFTTVMSWKIEPAPPIVDGRVYGGKDVEFERFLTLPSHTPERLEAAISGDAPRDRIRAAGWHVVDAQAVSRTPEGYRDYILASRGELSIAKNAYVATRSGWFSTRSAAYLAAARPVVLEETGFSAHLPTGLGLRAFTTIDEAVDALAGIRADYAGACAHARDVAETCFRAERVCERLLAAACG
ncbi:MAG: glycosyltransferase family 1 protein [Candidatus Binatia bacterium]